MAATQYIWAVATPVARLEAFADLMSDQLDVAAALPELVAAMLVSKN